MKMLRLYVKPSIKERKNVKTVVNLTVKMAQELDQKFLTEPKPYSLALEVKASPAIGLLSPVKNMRWFLSHRH